MGQDDLMDEEALVPPEQAANLTWNLTCFTVFVYKEEMDTSPPHPPPPSLGTFWSWSAPGF